MCVTQVYPWRDTFATHLRAGVEARAVVHPALRAHAPGLPAFYGPLQKAVAVRVAVLHVPLQISMTNRSPLIGIHLTHRRIAVP
eukprot:877608-Prorocentrum_minimum.AAC.1